MKRSPVHHPPPKPCAAQASHPGSRRTVATLLALLTLESVSHSFAGLPKSAISGLISSKRHKDKHPFDHAWVGDHELGCLHLDVVVKQEIDV